MCVFTWYIHYATHMIFGFVLKWIKLKFQREVDRQNKAECGIFSVKISKKKNQ